MAITPLPRLTPLNPSTPDGTDSVVLAVYAPFGGDVTLSSFPAATVRPIEKQALVQSLQSVAAEGVNVSALIDLFGDDSWLVEIPAGAPKDMRITSVWKQDMSAPQALAGFLRRTHACFPRSALVLALEGHGAGYLPDVDSARITPESTSKGNAQWRIDGEGAAPVDAATGDPILPIGGSPTLPVESPDGGAVSLPLSNAGLAQALSSAARAGVPRPAVIHFNNCFNMSVELLHTVAPFADYATGYANYNFFTAGAAYPQVFHNLATAGSATREQLARWFAAENGNGLRAKGNHPTIGATVALSRMRKVALAIDGLSNVLITALRPANPADRPPVLSRVAAAAKAAQHFDTQPGFELAVPDQLMDLGGFAEQLRLQFPVGPVNTAAAALLGALAGVWQYGDIDRPWVDENQIWDFRNQRLGMNVLFPDPTLQGIWDWRAPYYLAGKLDPSAPPAQKSIIPFLAERAGKPAPWVAFIIEYHRGVKFSRLLRVRPLSFPLFNRAFKAKLPHPDPNGPTGTPGGTGIPGTPGATGGGNPLGGR